MDRLNFRLPEWSRMAWVSEEAKFVWEPRMKKIQIMWEDVAKESVYHGLRSSILTTVGPEKLVDCVKEAAAKGFVAVPLSQQGIHSEYRSRSVNAIIGEQWEYRIAITKSELQNEWITAWNIMDNDKIGELLGFPKCCRTFFTKYWSDEQFLDTSWPMYEESEQNAEGPPECNVLLRWAGLRFVQHLPHSFQCEESVKIGRQFAQLGNVLGYHDEVAWLYEMLSWPVEWSALHGIGEIYTPIFKMSVSTDATPIKYIIQRKGITYPEEGASGNKFPWVNKRNMLKKQQDSRLWAENGFGTLEKMNSYHELVISAITKKMGQEGGYIMDAGCGNGLLLEKICNGYPNLIPYGIEVGKDAAESAKRRLVNGFIQWGNIFTEMSWDLAEKYKFVIFMPGRLFEVEEQLRLECVNRLKRKTDTLIIYIYEIGKLALQDLFEKSGLSADWKIEEIYESSDALCAAFRCKLII